MAILHCASHGAQEQTFVCRHIIATLKDGEPRGFFWNRADDAFEAVCTTCNDMTPDAAAAAGPDLVQSLCYGCFRDAASINGIDID